MRFRGQTWRSIITLLTLVVALLALTSGPAGAATTFTVNKTGDASDRKISDAKCDTSTKKGNQCTLRAAIEEANDTSGEDTIEFDIGSGSSVKTISPSSELPRITGTVTIDGYTQRGARQNTLEEGNDAVLKVEGNFVGTNAAGTTSLGNGEEGVLVASSDSNAIGGTQPAQRNVISGNDFEGVRITGSTSTGNSILSNEIFSNGGLGIDLDGGTEDALGVTSNDTDDTDTGPNDLQNFPSITSATKSTTTGFTAIAGALRSNPEENFLIQCFLAEDQPDASGHGEGAVLLDTTSRSTDSGGLATFQCDTQDLEAGQEVTATATNIATGDTSEFSDNEVITAP
jgi:hypothetical protein